MTEKVTPIEVESIISDYEASTNAVAEAEKTLETVKAQRDAKKALAEQKIEELKARLLTVESSSQEEQKESISEKVSSIVEEKLDEGKDNWTELTKTNPDEARRKLRTFWIIIAGSIGIISGGILSYIVNWLF